MILLLSPMPSSHPFNLSSSCSLVTCIDTYILLLALHHNPSPSSSNTSHPLWRNWLARTTVISSYGSWYREAPGSIPGGGVYHFGCGSICVGAKFRDVVCVGLCRRVVELGGTDAEISGSGSMGKGRIRGQEESDLVPEKGL
jgi:hypothetical protein